MSQPDRLSTAVLIWAAIAGATAVLFGSFGAHGIDQVLQQRGYDAELVAKRMDQWDVGVRYHLVHALALLALAAVPHGSPSSRRWVARLMIAGLVLFSGSLYMLVLTGVTAFGAVAPFGGLSWIIAWFMLIWMARSSSTGVAP